MKIQRLLVIAVFFVLAIPAGAHSELITFYTGPATTATAGGASTVSMRIIALGQTSGSLITGLTTANLTPIRSGVWDPSTDTVSFVSVTYYLTEYATGVYLLYITPKSWTYPSCGFLETLFLVKSTAGSNNGSLSIKIRTACPS